MNPLRQHPTSIVALFTSLRRNRSLILQMSEREVLIWGKMPDWAGLGIYCAGSLIFAWMGFWWFQKNRKGFADVL